MTRDDLSKAISLSCVENYFLIWCKKYFDERILYCDSFVSINKVLEDFLLNDSKYENYTEINRLQDLSENFGFTTHCKVNDLQTDFDYKKDLVLLKVNEKFFENSSRIPWRDDHYIWLTGKNEYLNNYPLSQGTIENIADIFGGNILIYSFEKINDIKFNFDKIINQDFEYYEVGDVDLTALRNAIGVLKISRKRLCEWLRYLSVSESLIKLLNVQIYNIEMLFIKIELQIARKTKNLPIIRQILEEITRREIEICKEIILLKK